MKALVLEKSTKVSDLKLSEIAIPKVKKDWALVKVLAFGLNHSEALFRQFEIDNEVFKKPIVPGIECVGIIVDSSNTNFKNGDKVMALMGGMGRSFNGSYEEYALLPKSHVFKINNISFDLVHLAAIPETYYTAWGSLFSCLHLKKDDSLLIRGGTSSLGIASIKIAASLGCKVYVTARNEKHSEFLKKLGVEKIIIDSDNSIKEKVDIKFDKILELVGPLTLKESLGLLKVGGICCSTGILGNVYVLNNFDPIKDIPNGCFLTGFYSNYPTQEEIDEMLNFLSNNSIIPEIGKVYSFSDVQKYSCDLEEGSTNGKGIVVVDSLSVKEDIVDKLITYFAKENGEDFVLPSSTYDEKRKLLRALVNIREPKKISEEILELEDKLLSIEREEKTLVNCLTLEEVEKNIALYKGDITTLETDVIVNAGNSDGLGCFVPNHACIDNAIHSAAGVRLRLECQKKLNGKGLNNGDILVCSGYNLPAKYVITTVGPQVYGKITKSIEQDLAKCYENSLNYAINHNFKSIVFPSISTGLYGYPISKAKIIAYQTVKKILKTNDIKVIFNLYSEDDYNEYQSLFRN